MEQLVIQRCSLNVSGASGKGTVSEECMVWAIGLQLGSDGTCGHVVF